MKMNISVLVWGNYGFYRVTPVFTGKWRIIEKNSDKELLLEIEWEEDYTESAGWFKKVQKKKTHILFISEHEIKYTIEYPVQECSCGKE